MPGTASPCDVCGQPTKSSLGVCANTPACRIEYRRRYKPEKTRRRKAAAGGAAQPPSACTICGQPMSRQSFLLICSRTAECRKAQTRLYAVRYRAKDPDREKQRDARYRASHPGRDTKYLQRANRRCKYAKLGCTALAVPGSRACRKHKNADNRQRHRRRRAKIKQKLAAAQNGICAWCGLPLPADLARTDVDHIIPVSRGGPDALWNLQLLHSPCNRRPGAKGQRLTSAALQLAAQYGVTVLA